jgi:hypothetical protein
MKTHPKKMPCRVGKFALQMKSVRKIANTTRQNNEFDKLDIISRSLPFYLPCVALQTNGFH